MSKNEEQTTMAQEPGLTGVYGKTTIPSSVIHRSSDIPCVYTDDEFRLLLHDAEKGKFQSDEDLRKMFTA